MGRLIVAAPRECPPRPPALHVWRCWRCERVIARLFLVPGCHVEIRCKGCGAVNVAIDNGAAR